MNLGYPILLWLLPPAFLLLLLAGWGQWRKQQKLKRFISESLLDGQTRRKAPALLRFRFVLQALGLLLCVFALSRPQWGYTWREANRRGLDLMVLLDSSKSMWADDFKPSRLQRAKWGLEELVKELQGDRIGLVTFAGEGSLLCPLTLDYAAFMMNLDDIFPGIVPKGGTNLAAGIRRSLESFEAAGEADRVLLVITDGESHEGDLDEVIRELKAENIRVFAIGIGSPEGALIPLQGEESPFLRNRRDEVIKSRLDEESLIRLAQETQGLYVRAAPLDFGVERILQEGLEPLQRTQLEGERIREYTERYPLFLGVGLLLIFFARFAQIPALLWHVGRNPALWICALFWISNLPAQSTNSLQRAAIQQILRQAESDYEQSEDAAAAERAAESFGGVASLESEDFDADALHLAEAMARLTAGNPEAALQALDRIQGFDEASERARSRLLRGNAHLSLAEAAGEDFERAEAELGQALNSYVQALKEEPSNPAIRHNLELAQKRLQELLLRKPPPTPTPQPTPTPEPTPSPEPQATPTPTPTPDPQATPTPEPEATPTPQPEGTPTPDPNAEATPTPDPEAEGEPTPDPEAQATPQPGEGDPQGEATPEPIEAQQAQQLLDAYREQEKRQRREIQRRNIRPVPVEKDW